MKPLQVLVSIRIPEALRDVLQGVLDYAHQRRAYWRLRCVNPDQFSELLLETKVDGAITAIASPDHPVMDVIRQSRVPVVNLIHNCQTVVPSVVSDERKTGRLAAEHLIARGYRRFACLSVDEVWSREREQGFAAALAEAGYSYQVCDALARKRSLQFFEDADAMARLRAWTAALSQPVAIFACTDQIAATALDLWTAADIKMPEQIGVIGVGNLVATCELATVPISSVGVDFAGMGYQASRILDDLMHHRASPTEAYVLQPPGVATRRSTEAFLFDDEHARNAMRIISDRAGDGLSMKQLLKHVPVSRRWLDEQFKRALGRTASTEMRRLRAERICNLLISTDLSVQQIASRCGFARTENLNRFFRDVFGMPPSQYRQQYGSRAGGSPRN